MLENYRILYDEFDSFLVKIDRDFQCHRGIIKKEDLLKEQGVVETHKKHKFFIIKPTLADVYQLIHRKTQVMVQKDLGLIITFSGINKESKILEAGTGNGTCTIILAYIAKKVVSYEIRKDHYEIAKKNLEIFGINNVILKNEDIVNVSERNFDSALLDLPEPWKLLEKIKKCVKPGGIISIYCPNLTQITKTIQEAKELKLRVLATKELIERNWIIDDKILRPENKEPYTHTAFITFLRKLS
ncbi:MAG: methyltransferase domain-containing protein [Candidatus Woesearchaeota archaeon]